MPKSPCLRDGSSPLQGVTKEVFYDIPMTPNRKVAIYARVSTNDKDQNPETQLLPLRKYTELRGWDVFDTYVDKESGRFEKKGKREAFNRMLADARKRRFDILLVFRYSRFARSTKDLVDALGDLRRSVSTSSPT